MGRVRRRQGGAGRSRAPVEGEERGVGRPHRAPRRRPQRDRGLPGDRGRGRRRRWRPLGLASGAAPPRRERDDRLRVSGGGPDPLRGPAHPALLRPLHERDHGDPRGLGVEARGAGGPARHHRLEAGAARAREREEGPRRLPARGGPRARPGPLGRGLRGPRSLRRRLRRDAHDHGRRTGDRAPRRAARLRFRAARREQPAGDDLLRARPARALPGPQPRPRLPPLRPPPPRRARARLRRGEGRAPPRPLRRERLPGNERLRGARRGRRQRDHPGVLLWPGPRIRAEGERLEALRRVDDLSRPRPPGRADLPLPARRALPAAVPRGATPRGERALEPGARGQAAPLPHQADHPGVPGPREHLEHPAAGLRHRRRRGRAGPGSPGVLLQRGPPAGPVPRDRRAGHRGPGRGLGGVQARRGPLLLLARRALEAQRAEAGRAEAERLGEPDHVRQPRAAPEADRGPGLDQRRRRSVLPRRGEAPPRGGPRDRRARSGPSSSPTCGAACRTTST